IEAAAFPANPHAAGRTTAPPPAYMGMRNTGSPAGLEHAGTGGDLDKAAVRIGDAHEAAATLPSPADEPGEEHGRYQSYENPGEGVGDFVEALGGFRRRQGHLGKSLASPAGIRGLCRDLAAGLDHAE